MLTLTKKQTYHPEPRFAASLPAGFIVDAGVADILRADGHEIADDQVAGWLDVEPAVWTRETRSVAIYRRDPAVRPVLAGEFLA